MKIVFLLFLLVINLNLKTNDIKCCDHRVEDKEEYVKNGFKRRKNYVVSNGRTLKKGETTNTMFTFVSKGNEELKFITELRYDSIDNMSVRISNNWLNLETNETDERLIYKTDEFPCDVKIISHKISETRIKLTKKGLYYFHFYGKNNQKNIVVLLPCLLEKCLKKRLKK